MVGFARDYDRAALDELIAVERECCPFFTFGFDEQCRRLVVGVVERDAAAALDAFAEAFARPGPEGKKVRSRG